MDNVTTSVLPTRTLASLDPVRGLESLDNEANFVILRFVNKTHPGGSNLPIPQPFVRKQQPNPKITETWTVDENHGQSYANQFRLDDIFDGLLDALTFTAEQHEGAETDFIDSNTCLENFLNEE